MRYTDTTNARLKNKKLREERIIQYNLSPKLCRNCKKPINYDKRINNFCSHSCSARFNNIGITRNPLKPRPDCMWCGKLLKSLKSKYCNLQCKSFHEIDKFFKHEVSNLYAGERTIKKYYISIRGHECEKCHTTLWLDKPIPLEMHHNDGDSKNHNPDNITLICRNCHAFTDTFSRRNHNCTRKRIYSLV